MLQYVRKHHPFIKYRFFNHIQKKNYIHFFLVNIVKKLYVI